MILQSGFTLGGLRCVWSVQTPLPCFAFICCSLQSSRCWPLPPAYTRGCGNGEAGWRELLHLQGQGVCQDRQHRGHPPVVWTNQAACQSGRVGYASVWRVGVHLLCVMMNAAAFSLCWYLHNRRVALYRKCTLGIDLAFPSIAVRTCIHGYRLYWNYVRTVDILWTSCLYVRMYICLSNVLLRPAVCLSEVSSLRRFRLQRGSLYYMHHILHTCMNITAA